MPLFGSNTTSTTRRRSLFHRTKPSRTTRIKNAIDPNTNSTTHTSSRVPFMTRVKRTLGIRSKPKRRGTFSRFQPRSRRNRQPAL